MEEVIKKIIRIENEAQKIMDDALLEKEEKESQHKEKIQALGVKILNDAKRKVEQIRVREFQEIQDAEEAKKNRCEKRLKQMDEYAKSHMDVWVKELVSRVLS